MQTWMHAMKELDDRPLRELVIPGSHDAGTFVMEHRIDNNSSKCQEISILEQLKAGSRYLDLRAWKASDGEYWLYHGKAWTHVKPTLWRTSRRFSISRPVRSSSQLC